MKININHFIAVAFVFLATVLIPGCSSTGSDNTVPVVTTSAVCNITLTTAECGGCVTSDGGAAVTTRGVCWCTNPTPAIEDNNTTDGSGTGSFTSNISSLAEATTYYVRAYATNNIGTGYGNILSFQTGVETVTDIDGNIYNTVKIGDQWWLMENLRVTHYRNGDPITHVTDGDTWTGLYYGAFCEYNNNLDYVETYGRLYNWYAVDDSRSIAPEGWHVPTDDDWKQLEMYLGMSQDRADTTGWRGTDEGGKLKESGTTHWTSPNEGATNESGFTALPGGYRGPLGGYYSMGLFGGFWSSTNRYPIDMLHRGLSYNHSQVIRDDIDRRHGLSIRCVRD